MRHAQLTAITCCIVIASTCLMPLEVRADTLFVDAAATGLNDGSSWSDALASLQSALSGATTGDEIWIRTGTYKPSNTANRSDTFDLDDDFSLYGGFAGGETNLSQRDVVANPTVLSGDLSANDGTSFANRSDNSYHVVTVSLTAASAVLDGVVVQGGNADGTTENQGGGTFVVDSATPGSLTLLLRNCYYESNSADDAGGAVATGTAGVSIRDSAFSQNRCRNDNTGDFPGGGALACARVEATRSYFTENRSEGSSGGAIRIGSIDEPDASVLVNVTILDNVGDVDGGGVLVEEVDVEFVNCLIARNEAVGVGTGDDGRGGGVFATGESAFTVTNCTIAENVANNEKTDSISGTGLGGGIYSAATGTVRIRSTVLWDNIVYTGTGSSQSHAAQLNIYPAPPTTAASPLAYSDIMNYAGCPTCTNPAPNFYNIGDDLLDHDPIFADPGADNYRHRTFSLFDTGDGGSLPADVNDVDDDSNLTEQLPLDLVLADRIRASDVDMGAYEWCLGDLDGDGKVDGADNGLLLAAWGNCPTNAPCLGDLNGDGVVDGGDTGTLLANWGCGVESGGESLQGGVSDPVEALLEEHGFEDLETFGEWLNTLDPAALSEVLEAVTW